MDDVSLQEGRLRATSGPAVIEGAALAGATISATLAGGVEIALRIDAVVPSASPDMLRYAVSAAAPGSLTFTPLCGATEGGAPVLAIPLSGQWDESEGTPTGGSRVDDPSKVTFACEGYALAKCVELGYAPWRRVTECRAPGECQIMALTPFHQACTRMLRADYCGDGTATTRDGTMVDVWDAVGLQADEAPSWPFEAEWTSGGAACVLQTRWPTAPSGDDVTTYIEERCPSRWRPEGCGAASSTFFAENGFSLPPKRRVLLRTRVAGSL